MRLIVSSNIYPLEEYNKDTLLLGQWCVAGDVAGTILDGGATMLRHPWADCERLEGDYKQIRTIYDRALVQLADHLGSINSVHLSQRGWEIFIGPWLRVFINCVFERFMLLESAINEYGATTLVHSDESVQREADTTSKFITDLQKPAWNEMFCSDIAKLAFPEMQRLMLDPVNRRQYANDKHAVTPVAQKISGIKNHVLAVVKRLDALAQRNKRFILHRVGMSWKKELLFMMRSRVFPHFFLPILEKVGQERDTDRRSFKLDFGTEDVARIAAALIGDYMPRIFLEDFTAAKSLIHSKYPRKPEQIITGVAYYTDDYFKLFTALAVEKGVKYTILQHGGAFGTAQINDEEELQMKTADYFMSWGWGEDCCEPKHARIIPGGAITISSKRSAIKPDSSGFIVLPVSEWTLQTFRLFSAPLSFRQLDYLNEISEFYRNLSQSAASILRLRLQPGTRGWHIEERLSKMGLEKTIIRTPGRFVGDLKSSRLAVVNTNSSTMLEAFAFNIPTVLLINDKLWPVRPKVQSYYNEMKEAGILYNDPISAAQHVSTIYDNPEIWWGSKQVQSARNRFVKKFVAPGGALMSQVRKISYVNTCNHNTGIS